MLKKIKAIPGIIFWTYVAVISIKGLVLLVVDTVLHFTNSKYKRV